MFASSEEAAETYLQVPLFIVFSVQFATDCTSSAAPRTVLQAAIARHAPAITTATNL
jgi:hypothetical protein